jgi:uncharacterized protein YhfF
MNLSEAKAKYPGSELFRFGDSKELCDELTSLIISGKKVATCDALNIYESGKEEFPRIGRVDIALTWEGNPAVAIRTIEIKVMKFTEVDEEFALAEGENDDLEGWQKAHKEYFERNGGYDPDMKLVCERFEVIEVFG